MKETRIERLEDIMKLADIDPKHQTGEIIGSMTTNIHPRVFDIVSKFIEKNQNDHVLFPSLSIIEDSLLKETRRILGISEDVKGLITSGGTESNILAIYAAKKIYGSKTIISLESAHQSINKAALLLDLNRITLSVDNNGFYNSEEMVKTLARNPNSILVLTMGTTEIGRVDRVDYIVDYIIKYHIHLHIDAAMGGFTYPFTNTREFEVYRELIHQGLASFSTDYHKFPGAPVPSSVLFFNPRMEEAIRWKSHYMPAGFQKGLLGTRPGYSAAGALATLLLRGEEGLSNMAKEALSLALWTKNKLENSWNFEIPTPDVPLICIGMGNEELARRAWKHLWDNGIKTYYCSKPIGLRVVFMPHVTKRSIEKLVGRLLEVLQHNIRELNAG